MPQRMCYLYSKNSNKYSCLNKHLLVLFADIQGKVCLGFYCLI